MRTPTPRSLAKWTAAAGALLLLTAFVLSMRYHVTIRHPNTWRLEVSGGAARLNWDTGRPTAPRGPTQYDAGAHSAPMEWLPRPYRRVGWPGVIIPLWIPLAAFALSAAALRRGIGRRRLGTCRGCGYDLRGLPPRTVCPECGAGRA